MGYAYWSEAVRDAMTARDAAPFARIATGGPWQFREAEWGGKHGVVAEWLGQRVELDDYAPPRPCADGLLYFAPKEPLKAEDLAKRSAPKGIDYTTTQGVTITIALASAAPRFLLFDGPLVVGDLASEYAALAVQVFDKLATKDAPTWGELSRLLLLAVAQSYRVTAESLSDLRWITTADADPMLAAIAGYDPKASPDAGDTSPSPAPGSPTSP